MTNISAKSLEKLTEASTETSSVSDYFALLKPRVMSLVVFTAFVGKSNRYDIVIGDSQWLGRNSDGGHYVDLTDWIL